MDKLSYHNWKRYWLQLCRLLLILTTICLTSAILLIIFNVIASVNGNGMVDYQHRPQHQPFQTDWQRSHSHADEIIIINKNREKREAPVVHDSTIQNQPTTTKTIASVATTPPVIITGTNQLVPNVVVDRHQQNLPIVNNQLIVNRYSVNRNVKQPYWMVQQNSTLDSNANVTTSIRLISHQRLQQPQQSQPTTLPSNVRKTGGQHKNQKQQQKQQRRWSAFRKNVLNNSESLLPQPYGGALNINRNQHVLPTKQYELDNSTSHFHTNSNGNSNNGKIIYTNSNSKPKNSIKVVKSNLSKQIIEGYDVGTAASETHIIKFIDDLSSIDVLRSNERNDVSEQNTNQIYVRDSGTNGEDVHPTNKNKNICAPCRVIPGQPTRRITFPVTTRPWAWNRGMFQSVFIICVYIRINHIKSINRARNTKKHYSIQLFEFAFILFFSITT